MAAWKGMRKGKGMRGMEKLRIGERVDSDPHPVEVWIKGGRKKGEKSERGKGGKIGGEYGMKKVVGSLKEEWRR